MSGCVCVFVCVAMNLCEFVFCMYPRGVPSSSTWAHVSVYFASGVWEPLGGKCLVSVCAWCLACASPIPACGPLPPQAYACTLVGLQRPIRSAPPTPDAHTPAADCPPWPPLDFSMGILPTSSTSSMVQGPRCVLFPWLSFDSF